jgi:hypothetical protein
VVAALDKTTTATRSRFLDFVVSNTKNITPNPKPAVGVSGYQDITHIDPFGVLLPSKLAPAASDPFILKKEVHPQGLTKFVVPSFSREETESLLKRHLKCGILLRSKTFPSLFSAIV